MERRLNTIGDCEFAWDSIMELNLKHNELKLIHFNSVFFFLFLSLSIVDTHIHTYANLRRARSLIKRYAYTYNWNHG